MLCTDGDVFISYTEKNGDEDYRRLAPTDKFWARVIMEHTRLDNRIDVVFHLDYDDPRRVVMYNDTPLNIVSFYTRSVTVKEFIKKCKEFYERPVENAEMFDTIMGANHNGVAFQEGVDYGAMASAMTIKDIIMDNKYFYVILQ
jgi:hypothetical protein